MATKTFEPSLALTLAHEGGFVNHPKDPGGATNKGVTKKVYDAYRRNKGEAIRSVREITDVELKDIYRNQYWNVAGCNLLPAGLDYAVFDYAVNSGPGRAVKDLQRTINSVGNQLGVTLKVGVDSDFGQATLEAANACMAIDEEGFIESYCNRRMDFFHSLKTFKTFGKGWTRRVLGDKPNKTADEGDNGVIDYAVAMAKNDLAFPIKKADLPTAIGDKKGEVGGKAPESAKAVTKTPEGIGSIVAGLGVSGVTISQASDAMKAHINDTALGRVAAIMFGVLTLAGVGLVVYKFWSNRREQSVS